MVITSLTGIKTVFHSIRWKLIFAYLLIIAIAFIVIGFSLVQLVGDYLLDQRMKEDQRIAELLSEQLIAPMQRYDVDAMVSYASEVCQNTQNRVLVLDTYGVVQIDTQSMLNGTRFRSREAADVLNGQPESYGYYDAERSNLPWPFSVMHLFSYVDHMTGVFAAGIPAPTEGASRGVVVYISQIQDIYSGLRNMQLQIIAWLVVVAFAVVLLTMFVMRSITRPIGELQRGITQMSSGDFSARVNVKGRNEFSELADAFNSMSERLEQLDTSRNQFVSDASHELKTPLSAMKILIESLLYQDPIDQGMAKEFLGDVDKEIDRLSRTISDLLTLVNAERKDAQLNCEPLDVRTVMLEQIRRLAPLARENGIELNQSGSDELIVYGDKVKLEQVIYNVIDNAIKYTQRGGTVDAVAARSGKKAVIRISDTGIGIPAKDLPHIFERFYRVDKARSRVTGGTGLGLSIVKQMIQLHGGTITAASEEGKGTTFTIELPLIQK